MNARPIRLLSAPARRPVPDGAAMVRVVLADDSPEVRRLLRLSLADAADIDVVGEAADGAEALAVIDAVRPDVVLLDVAMPVMDGLDVLDELRRRYGRSVIAVVWSGFSAAHVAERALALGAHAYLEKSGDLTEVLAALRAAGRRERYVAGSAPTDGTADLSAVPPAAGTTALPNRAAYSNVTAPGRPKGVRPAPAESGSAAAVQPQPGPVRPAPLAGSRWVTPVGRDRMRMARRSPVVAVALVVFAGITLWQALVGRDSYAVSVLYVLPIAALAVQCGLRGGAVGASVGSVLFLAQGSRSPADIEGIVAAVVTFIATGLLLGWYSDQAHRLWALRDRDQTAVATANRRLAAAAAEARSANAELEATNEDLRQFMHVAGHDLGEPLRTIEGFAGLIRDGYGDALGERGLEYLRHIGDGAARMQQLVADLTAYTRAGQQDLRRSDVDLGDVVRSVRLALGATLRDRGAVLEVDEVLPCVSGDAGLLGLVFQNLISNGIKFNRSPVPTVSVSDRTGSVSMVQDSAVPGRGPKGQVVIEVADNGIGIEPGHEGRVFDLFQRLHTREEYPGTGLGLAICRRIVERHGGTITYRSEPGAGTTFVLALPGSDAG